MSLARALAMLAAGHLMAMAAVLLPFSALLALAAWEREIRIGAALLVIGLGLYLLFNRRHPRFLARVPPGRLALWSFLAALAHGAGLMLVPIYLGICQTMESIGGYSVSLIGGGAGIASLVAVAHTLAMTLAGGILASAVYWWLGLRFLSQSWFNLEIFWALSLMLVGAISLAAMI